MGFDFTMVQKPLDLPATYKPLNPEEPGYYQVTGAAMNLLTITMDAAQVLDFDIEPPNFEGCWPPEGLDEDRAEEIFDALDNDDEPVPPMTDSEARIVEAYREEMDYLLGVRSQEERVPSVKFTSNDGWLVHPEECQFIAEKLDDLIANALEIILDALGKLNFFGREENRNLIVEWRNYNALAAKNGGFRVN